MRYGWYLVITCLILFLIYLRHYTGPCNLFASSISQIEDDPSRAPFLVIIAEARSGSTWLGSFFKENENVLHFFEPLDERVLNKVVNSSKLTSSEKTNIKLEILANECQCKFKDVPVPVMGVIPIWSKSLYGLLGYLDKDGVVLPAYRKPRTKELASTHKKAIPNLELVEEFCKTRDLISAKIIRLHDIGQLLRLRDLGCKNYRVLHLIRDPRPIIHSRVSTFGELQTGNGARSTKFSEHEIKEAARGICSNYVKNVNIGRQGNFAGRYMLVLYEDIVQNPLKYAEEIYSYVGLVMTKSVKDYIDLSSHGTKVKDMYSVVKNSAEVVDRWKKEMNEDYIRWVEEECSEMLELFGYTKLF